MARALTINSLKKQIEKNEEDPKALRKISILIDQMISRTREKKDLTALQEFKLLVKRREEDAQKKLSKLEKLRDEWRRELLVVINTLKDIPEYDKNKLDQLPSKTYFNTLKNVIKSLDDNKKSLLNFFNNTITGFRKTESLIKIFSYWYQASLIDEFITVLSNFINNQSLEEALKKIPIEEKQKLLYKDLRSVYDYLQNLYDNYINAKNTFRQHIKEFIIPLRNRSVDLIKPKYR